MESAICLRYCPFPYGSKGLQAARPSRFHLKFNHATPFYVPQFSTTTLPVTRSIKHANCMLERFSAPSENERKSGNKILRGVTAVSLVLACVLGLFNFRGKMNPKFNTAYAQPPQHSFDLSKVDADGRSALQSLLEIMSDQEPSTDRNQTPPDENDVNNLKLLAIHKSKSKEGIDALNKLEKYYREYKKNDKEKETKEYIEVALVEVFMFQGNFKEARNRLDQQIDELIKTLSPEKRDEKKPKWGKRDDKWDELLDCYNSELGPLKLGIAKRILYKAIVHTMLDDKKANVEAKKWGQTFMRITPFSQS